MNVPGSWTTSCSLSTFRRTGTTTYHGSRTTTYCFYYLLGRNKMYMSINRSGGTDGVLSCNNFCICRYDKIIMYAIHHIWISGLTYGQNQSIFDANVCFNNTHQRIDQYGV